MPWSKIALILGRSEASIRRRISKLLKQGVIKKFTIEIGNNILPMSDSAISDFSVILIYKSMIFDLNNNKKEEIIQEIRNQIKNINVRIKSISFLKSIENKGTEIILIELEIEYKNIKNTSKVGDNIIDFDLIFDNNLEDINELINEIKVGLNKIPNLKLEDCLIRINQKNFA